MRGKWVDNSDYFGPDRRRTSARRWNERRRYDETLPEAPSLAAMLRRVRVQILGMSSSADRMHVMQLITAATSQAELQRNLACADIIRDISRTLMSTHLTDAALRARLDSRLIDALNAANPR